jgi:hypothetical protein
MYSLESLPNAVVEKIETMQMSIRYWQEYFFDLTDGETEEAYVFRVPKRCADSLESFIATGLLHVMAHLGLDRTEALIELKKLSATAGKGRAVNSNAWGYMKRLLSVDHPLHYLYTKLEADVHEANCIFEIEVGPSSVQAFSIAETQTEFISIFWYSTG